MSFRNSIRTSSLENDHKLSNSKKLSEIGITLDYSTDKRNKAQNNSKNRDKFQSVKEKDPRDAGFKNSYNDENHFASQAVPDSYIGQRVNSKPDSKAGVINEKTGLSSEARTDSKGLG